MGPRLWPGLWLAVLVGAVPGQAAPAPELADTAQLAAPILPATLAPELPRHFVVGVVLERGGHDLGRQRLLADQLIGLSVAWRGQRLGVEGRLMLSPNLDQETLEDIRGQAALGPRGYFRLHGRELSVGAGLHVEARLRNHFWLAYLTALELGTSLYERGSFRVGLFVGVRRLVAGRLLNVFLVDPNGFESEDAEDALQKLRDGPWELFARVVFGRRLD